MSEYDYNRGPRTEAQKMMLHPFNVAAAKPYALTLLEAGDDEYDPYIQRLIKEKYEKKENEIKIEPIGNLPPLPGDLPPFPYRSRESG